MCLRATAHLIPNLQIPETLCGRCWLPTYQPFPVPLAVKALNLFWLLSHILMGSGSPSPSPAQRRWNRFHQSFRFQFLFLIIRLLKSCDIPWPMRSRGSLTGDSWEGFPCFYNWVFKKMRPFLSWNWIFSIRCLDLLQPCGNYERKAWRITEKPT